MKLSVDINVVKEFLESSFYHCVENHCVTLCYALMGHPIPPLPPSSSQLVVNWMKLIIHSP